MTEKTAVDFKQIGEEAAGATREVLRLADASTSLEAVSDAATKGQQQLQGFASAVLGVQQPLEEVSSLTEEQTRKLAAFNLAVFGATEQFKGFGNETLTVSSRLSDVYTKLTQGGGLLGGLMKGAESAPFLKSLSGAISLIKSFGENAVRSADNIIRLRDGFIATAASSGSLNELFKASGENLENMNGLVVNQALAMNDSAGATNTTLAQMQEYYKSLAVIPGALHEMVQSGKGADSGMSMLVATTRMAHGTGRDYAEIVKDLAKAYEDYGLKGEPALRFTGRISELSGKYQVQLGSIQKSLVGTADAFKKYVEAGESGNRMAEGAANIMNNYIGALRETGITGERASEIIGNMTNGISGLGTAQKALLSAQTGGPGGLMGAFQIQKMIREGDIEGVMDKAQEALRKQFGGRIVTQDEAATSQAAAAQFQKQLQVLMQGPLKGLFKDEADAGFALDAMAAGKKVPASALSGDVVQRTMERGEKIEDQSRTAVSVAQNLQDKAQIVTGATTLDAMQRSGLYLGRGAKSSDDTEGDSEEVKAAREILKRSKETMEKGAAETAKRDKVGLGAKTGTLGLELLKGVGEFTKTVAPSVISSAKAVLGFGSAESATKAASPEVLKQRSKELGEAIVLGKELKEKKGLDYDGLSQLSQLETLKSRVDSLLAKTSEGVAGTVPQTKVPAGKGAVAAKTTTKTASQLYDEAYSELQRDVGSAVPAATAASTKTAAETKTAADVVAGQDRTLKVDVKVDTTCPKCQHKPDVEVHSHVSTASAPTPPKTP